MGSGVIVTKALAEKLFPGQDPLGKRIRMSAPGFPWLTVIGVVDNVELYSLGDSARLEMFVPYTQKPYPSMRTMQFVVRTAESPAATAFSPARISSGKKSVSPRSLRELPGPISVTRAPAGRVATAR